MNETNMMDKFHLENLAFYLSMQAHKGQKYAHHDYFYYHVRGVADRFRPLHPLETTAHPRPALKYGAPRGYDHEAYVTALLHAVVEDTDVTIQTIEQLFPRVITRNLVFLTKCTREKYLLQYIDKLAECGSVSAIAVKLADLEFNLSQPEPRTEGRYLAAVDVLQREYIRLTGS